MKSRKCVVCGKPILNPTVWHQTTHPGECRGKRKRGWNREYRKRVRAPELWEVWK